MQKKLKIQYFLYKKKRELRHLQLSSAELCTKANAPTVNVWIAGFVCKSATFRFIVWSVYWQDYDFRWHVFKENRLLVRIVLLDAGVSDTSTGFLMVFNKACTHISIRSCARSFCMMLDFPWAQINVFSCGHKWQIKKKITLSNGFVREIGTGKGWDFFLILWWLTDTELASDSKLASNLFILSNFFFCSGCTHAIP